MRKPAASSTMPARLSGSLGHGEFAALIRELELIRRWRPGYNVQGQPGRERQVYLCVGRKPALYVYATREPKGNEIACYGPIKAQGMAQPEAARRLNDLFHLRDCSQHQSMHFAEQAELFPIVRTAGCLHLNWAPAWVPAPPSPRGRPIRDTCARSRIFSKAAI